MISYQLTQYKKALPCNTDDASHLPFQQTKRIQAYIYVVILKP